LVNKGLSFKVLSLLIGGAAVSEVLQYFSIARQPRIDDFIADFFGILTAALFFLLYLLIKLYSEKTLSKLNISTNDK